MWDLDTKRRQYHEDNAHKDTITSFEFIPSLSMVATGSIDKSIKFWEIETMRSRGKPLNHGEPVKSLCSNSEKLVSCGPCTLIVWEFQSMGEICRVSPGNNSTFVKAKVRQIIGIASRCVSQHLQNLQREAGTNQKL